MIIQPVFAAVAGGVVGFLVLCTLIGLVLGVLIPRTSMDDAAAQTPGTEPAARQPTS